MDPGFPSAARAINSPHVLLKIVGKIATYKILDRTLEFADFLQSLIVPLDFVDVHGQILKA